MLELKLSTELSFNELIKLSASLTEMLSSTTIRSIRKRQNSFDEDSFSSMEEQNEWLSRATTRQLNDETMFIQISFDDKTLVQDVLKSICFVRKHIRLESAEVFNKTKEIVAKYRVDFEDYINGDSDEISIKYISERSW